MEGLDEGPSRWVDYGFQQLLPPATEDAETNLLVDPKVDSVDLRKGWMGFPDPLWAAELAIEAKRLHRDGLFGGFSYFRKDRHEAWALILPDYTSRRFFRNGSGRLMWQDID